MKNSISFTRYRLIPLILAFALLGGSNLAEMLPVSFVAILLMNMIVMYLKVSQHDAVNKLITDDAVRATSLSLLSFVDTIFITVGYIFFGQVSKSFAISTAMSALSIFPVLAIVFLCLMPTAIKTN